MRTRPDISGQRRQRKQTYLLSLLIAAALVLPFRIPFAAAAASAESTIVLQTAGAPLLESTAQTINTQLGNQTNPHLQCNLAAYTFDDFQGHSSVHYRDLTTGSDGVVPGNEVDLLPDVSGSRVAYTEVTFDGDTVRVFDTSSQTQTIVPGLKRSNPSIGGNTVAFEDRSGSTLAPQIATYDLSTGTVTPLTNDALANSFPNTSPDGNVVVWDKCQTNGLVCAVYAAVQTAPGVFTTKPLTDAGGRWHLPFTDGQIAVYVSDRSGENDVYYQTLASGAEVHLAIPGDQRWARISGHLITFESQDANGYDIFLYDIRSGKLSRVTNTPGIDETLSEIDICNGVGRIIYSIPGDGSFDLYAVSFAAPSVTQEQIDDLIALIRGFNLPSGTANSLVNKLQSALAAIDAGDNATACTYLTSFVNECAAQSGKKLTPAQATQLIDAVNVIKTAVCGQPAMAFATQVTQPSSTQVKTDSKMAYHNGPIVTGTPGVYLIWYGTWDDNAANLATQMIVTDFLANVGGSPYFQINAMYPNNIGGAPSGGLLYAGAV